MVRGCPVLVASRAWRPASRPILPNSRAIGCRCSMQAEQAGENAKGTVQLCGAHPVRGPWQRRARSHLASWLSSTQQIASIVRIERTVRWLVWCTGGGRYERVQDRDRAESMAANVATGGGGGDIVRRVLFSVGAGADQDRLWRIAHGRARLLGQGPSDVQADLGRGDQREGRAARPSDQARLLRRPDQRRDRARHLREADRRR